ncbi:hypothetical protein [Paraburkholderia caffeinilytica]|uniref:hypothetical protein n=1 Tax=Paraburkholderia caffeinilytica TaxID=1761016 RepID=UPI003D9FC147
MSRFLCLSFFAAAKKVSACPAQGRTLIDQYQFKESPKNPDQGKAKESGSRKGQRIQIKEIPKRPDQGKNQIKQNPTAAGKQTTKRRAGKENPKANPTAAGKKPTNHTPQKQPTQGRRPQPGRQKPR